MMTGWNGCTKSARGSQRNLTTARARRRRTTVRFKSNTPHGSTVGTNPCFWENKTENAAKKIFRLMKIHRWFLVQIKEIVDFEEKLAGAKN